MSTGAPYDSTPAAPPREAYLPIPHFRPVWTYILLALNIAVWLAVQATFEPRGGGVVVEWLVKSNELIAQGQYWRLLTTTFLHVAMLHVFSNMLSLYVLGPQIESTFGSRRFLVVYVLSGLLGSALSYLLTPADSLGASGAIFGLLGALVAYLARNRAGFGEVGRRRLMNVLFVIGINVAVTLGVPNIDLWGHAGGLLGGLALGWALAPLYRIDRGTLWGTPQVVDGSSPRARTVMPVAVTLALILVVALGTLRWS